MMRDLHSNIEVQRAISPTRATDDTPLVSQIIDTANFGAVEFLIATGAIADANVTFTVLLEDGDDSALGDNAAVADAYLLGTEAAAGFQFDDDNEVRKLGYIGPKRYLRMTITPSGNGGNADISVVAILSRARKGPRS